MSVQVGVSLSPVDTRKVDAALVRIQSAAKGVSFGNGAKSIEKLSRPLGKITGQATEFQKSLEASNARVIAFGASVAVINKLSEAFGALVQNTVKVEATFRKNKYHSWRNSTAIRRIWKWYFFRSKKKQQLLLTRFPKGLWN